MGVHGGIDWAEGHHDIALVDDDGRLVAKRRISETLTGNAAHHNRGCSWGLNPPASSRQRAM